MLKKKRKSFKVDLPVLQVSAEDYATLDVMTDGDMVGWLEELIRVVIHASDPTELVILGVPAPAYDAFERWTRGGEELPQDAMARFIDSEGKRIAEMMNEAGTVK